MDYLKSHKKKLQNMHKNKTLIFVCDKAYHSRELFYLLDEYGFKFVIRLKDNNLISSNKKTTDKYIYYLNCHLNTILI